MANGNDADRLSALQQEAFDHAVTEATGNVSQKLAALHRRRLVTQTAAIVAVVVTLISFVVMLAVRAQIVSNQKANAQYNCVLLTNIAEIMGSGNTNLTMHGQSAGFLSSESALRKSQALDDKQIAALHPGALKSLFNDPETARLTKLSQQQDAQTTAYWDHVLIPALTNLAQTDCSAHLR